MLRGLPGSREVVSGRPLLISVSADHQSSPATDSMSFGLTHYPNVRASRVRQRMSEGPTDEKHHQPECGLKGSIPLPITILHSAESTSCQSRDMSHLEPISLSPQKLMSPVVWCPGSHLQPQRQGVLVGMGGALLTSGLPVSPWSPQVGTNTSLCGIAQ